jgi:Carboxypeptidase regulatory-like domain
VLACGFPAKAQAGFERAAFMQGAQSARIDAPGAGAQAPAQQAQGSIAGTVLDGSGAAVAGARVRLTQEGQTAYQEVVSGDDGQFSFGGVLPGPFKLTVTATGFVEQVSSGTLHPGEAYLVPPITLEIASSVTVVRVGLTRAEEVQVAGQQIQQQEKQRVLGVIPNFYVSYVADAAPLTSRQKFQLAWKSTLDPVTFVLTGALAGIQQAQNQFSGYGQGAQGYGKRYGAAYADIVSSTFLGGAIFPSLLKQDPRYFYKGSGSTRSRILYAMANAVICKGDDKHWQPNYSGILGGLAAGGLSNAYYPAENRNGAALTFESAALDIGASAAANLLEEFVFRKITPNLPSEDPAKSQTPPGF